MSDTIDDTPTHDEAPARRLVRTDDGRWLGGVCAGLGRYFDINPLVYRIAFAALALAGGTGLLLYLAAYLVIPDEHADESIAVEALRGHRDHPWLLLGVGLLSFGALFALSEASFWPGTGNFWLAATLVGGALVWWHVSNRDRAPRQAAARRGCTAAETATAEPRPARRGAARHRRRASHGRRGRRRSRRSSRPALGALLAAAGVFGLLAVLDIYDVDLDVALAAGVAIVGGAIAVGAMTQRRVGGLVFLGLLLLAAFGVAAATPVSVSSGVGEKTERPLTVAALQPSYELGIGELDLDLSAVSLPSGTTSVDASVGIGSLVITVPEDVALEIDAQAGVGEIDVLGARDDGVDAHRTLSLAGSTPDAPVLERRGRRRYRQHRGAARLSSTSYRLPLALPRLRRAESEGALAGVCAGIAKSLRVDATLVRLTFALLAFAGGAGIAAYGGAWLALAPESGPPPSPRRRLLGFVALAIAGAIALRGFGFSDSLIWPAALCGAGILLARGRSGARSWSASRSRPSE